MGKLARLFIQHEGVKGNQTPFRITDPKMAKWTSMFDNTPNKIELDPNAKKSPGTEKFIYTKKPEDVERGVNQQLDLYHQRDPNMTVADAAKKFDQTGSAGKIKFLQKNGIDTNAKLKDVQKLSMADGDGPDAEDFSDSDGEDMRRQFSAMKGV